MSNTKECDKFLSQRVFGKRWTLLARNKLFAAGQLYLLDNPLLREPLQWNT